MKVLRSFISLLVGAFIFGVVYILMLPTLNLKSAGTLLLIGLSMLIGFFIMWSFADATDDCYPSELVLAIGITLVVISVVSLIASSPLFHAKSYSNSVVVNTIEDNIEEALPKEEDLNNVSLMDTASAEKLGDRTLGTLTDLVSQYEVDNYYTISYDNQLWKIAPLKFGGFFKAMKNTTIPGYVLVNPLTNEAKYIKVEGGIKYAPSAYFGKDLNRHVSLAYPTLLIDYDSRSFQIDDEGGVFWVIPTEKYNVGNACKTPNGTIICDAVTGETNWYSLEDIPSWVDLVFTGDTVETMYNRHGEYINGFINLNNEGVTATTDDFGYIQKDDTVYVYTGITSVSSDESNLGFIMVNTRTGEFNYYPIAGAEEYSAMGAAEGLVQNYSYKASFPTLVLINNSPTYVMVLKDDNGLVKQYAMVNMENYSIVATGESLKKAKKNYLSACATTGKGIVSNIDESSLVENKITIKDIQFLIVDGETICYIKSKDGKCFKESFSSDERLILLDVGDKVTIYSLDNSDISDIVEIK